MLACARIGAPAQRDLRRLRARGGRAIASTTRSPRVLITADGGCRRGGIVPLKKNVDEALRECPDVKTVIVLKRTRPGHRHGSRAATSGGTTSSRTRPPTARPRRWTPRTCCTSSTPRAPRASRRASCTPPAATSPGSTRPRKWVFDLHDTDVYWCTADIGWVTGHSYIVYGPLANGATTVMYEGTPDYPDKDRFWRIVEKYGVTICYTAPTAIRTFMRWGEEYPKRCDLSSLRLLGIGRRADQPGGVGLVLEGHRRRPLPGGGHLVADRDRPHPDHAAARDHHAQARLGDPPVPGYRGRRGQRQGRAGQGRLPRAQEAVAGHAARHLPRPAALRRPSTGASTRASTSRATAPRSTRTATSGCSAGWTTS